MNASGNSSPSGENHALTVPTAPTGLGPTPISTTQVNLSWYPTSGATGYYVYRGTSAGGESTTTPRTAARRSPPPRIATPRAAAVRRTIIKSRLQSLGHRRSIRRVQCRRDSPGHANGPRHGYSTSQINLNWNFLGPAAGYYVYRGTSAGHARARYRSTAPRSQALPTATISPLPPTPSTTTRSRRRTARAARPPSNSAALPAEPPATVTATSYSATQINMIGQPPAARYPATWSSAAPRQAASPTLLATGSKRALRRAATPG